MNQIPEGKTIYFDWLDNLNFSQAFVVCVGAGPWKEKRRKKVALDKLKNNDLCEFHKTKIIWFPFDWQNNLIENAAELCYHMKTSFEQYCSKMRDQLNKLEYYLLCINPDIDSNDLKEYLELSSLLKTTFYHDFGYGDEGIKVLSLFLRDKINIYAFPIDRHIKRNLEQHGLPYDEGFIIYICGIYGVDPSQLNRYIFNSNSSNPQY